MGANSKIEWTHHTFNPWIGCAKVSPGCANCYAEEMMDKRYGRAKWGDNGTRVRTSEANWKKPLQWDKQGPVCVDCGTPITNNGTSIDCECGQVGATGKMCRPRVFCASLADVFEDRDELKPWREDLLDLIKSTPHIDWLLLTKRPENVYHMMRLDCELPMPNVWIGTSVENQEQADKRIPELLKIPAKVRFLSMEPLLGPVALPAVPVGGMAVGGTGVGCYIGTHRKELIHWVIVGGESGHNARPMHPDWARSLRDQCQAAGVPFFMKQWGEWLPITQATDEQCQGRALAIRHDGATFEVDEPHGFCCSNCNVEDTFRVGKHAAGRELDGRTWDEVPE